MKVWISNYRHHWFSPYVLCKRLCWWREINYDEPWVRRVNCVLEPVAEFVQNVLDRVHPRIEYVKIDRWDSWNMNNTLALIALPMLQQLKRTKQGSPCVEDQDVPEHLRRTAAPPVTHEWDIDDNWEARWDWVLDEIIWSMEQINTDWEEQYHRGVIDWQHVPCEWDEAGRPKLYTLEHGPNHTHEFDREGHAQHDARIDRGLSLFGKYYRALWD